MNYLFLILAFGILWFFIIKNEASNPDSKRRKMLDDVGKLWYFLSAALLYMIVSIPIGLFISWLRSLSGEEIFWLTEASHTYLVLSFATIIEILSMMYFKNKEKQKEDC